MIMMTVPTWTCQSICLTFICILHLPQISFSSQHRLAKAYTLSSTIDNRVRETQAGRAFLEILKHSHDPVELPTKIGPTGATGIDHISAVKVKRNSLRTALEHLIVEYLRELSPDGDEYMNEYERNSLRRRRRRSTTEENDDDGGERNETTVGDNCEVRHRKVGQLDQFKLDAMMVNESETDHNIRRVLNYRYTFG